MNPFETLTSNHSSWPILLVIYNWPHALCMNRKYMMLSMMIFAPKQPWNDLDVYLNPLIEDLKLSWHEGVDVFDLRMNLSNCMKCYFLLSTSSLIKTCQFIVWNLIELSNMWKEHVIWALETLKDDIVDF